MVDRENGMPARWAARTPPISPSECMKRVNPVGAIPNGRALRAPAISVLRSVELLPRILHGVAAPDLSVEIAGARSALPFGIAPTGFTRFMHAEGEDAGAAAAAPLAPAAVSYKKNRAHETSRIISVSVFFV